MFLEKFTLLAKILHCRRQWRQGQISPLDGILFCFELCPLKVIYLFSWRFKDVWRMISFVNSCRWIQGRRRRKRRREGGCGYKRGTLKQLVVATLPPFESLLPMLSFCHTGENSQRCALHNYVTILKPPSNVRCPLLVITGCCMWYIH